MTISRDRYAFVASYSENRLYAYRLNLDTLQLTPTQQSTVPTGRSPKAVVTTSIGTLAPPNDFNGDDFSDVLWQHASGEVSIWEMNGTTVIGGGSFGNPGPLWHAIR